MKEYSFREFDKVLKKGGWFENRAKGSHRIYVKENNPRHISVPFRNSISEPLTRRLLKEAGIAV